MSANIPSDQQAEMEYIVAGKKFIVDFVYRENTETIYSILLRMMESDSDSRD